MDWMDLVQDRDKWLVRTKTAMRVPVPENKENCLSSWVTVSFSKKNSVPLSSLNGPDIYHEWGYLDLDGVKTLKCLLDK